MTDEQLMLLEQLTYLNENVYNAAGIKPKNKADNVEKLLEGFDESALEKLESAPTDVYLTEENSYIQAAEWAATIRAIKADDELTILLIKSGGEYENNVFATVYQDPEKGADSAIVTFRGTATPEEWHDNAKGLYMSDTPIQ